MIYILCALKIEADAIINEYSLQKIASNIYKNSFLTLCITGVGKENVLINLSTFLAKQNITHEDIFINIGICAGDENYNIGSLYHISHINDIAIADSGEKLHTFEDEQNSTCNTLADMESLHVYNVLKRFKCENSLHVMKVVSDHFKPQSVDKNLVYSLINKNISSIKSYIDKLPKIKKDVAVVTGSSSGIGKEIALRLLDMDYEVYGISRSDADIEDDSFRQIPCNLSNISTCKLDSIKDVSVLINCAGVGKFDPLEAMKEDDISYMVDLNLKSALILTSMFVKDIKKNQGHIINISSIEATRSSKFSSIYSATKSALKAFSNSLAEDLRRDKVNVTSINPDMTDTPFFDELRFAPSSKEDEHLKASNIADVVQNILESNTSVLDITLRSKKFGIVKK
jgi:short-subunit dehydrogenase